jgi:hypothetical protein
MEIAIVALVCGVALGVVSTHFSLWALASRYVSDEGEKAASTIGKDLQARVKSLEEKIAAKL